MIAGYCGENGEGWDSVMVALMAFEGLKEALGILVWLGSIITWE